VLLGGYRRSRRRCASVSAMSKSPWATASANRWVAALVGLLLSP